VSLRIPILAGPTASGKTALSLELGATFPLEVVSSDAMMVYKRMDIGTAKPSLGERGQVPHHLIDVLEPGSDFSVAQWVHLAELAITDILARGRIPFVVGGTGFYIRALSQGLPSTPPSKPELIANLEHEFEVRGLDDLIAEVAAVSQYDADRAERNPRRVLRALEIIRVTGKPASAFEPQAPKFKFAKIALIPPREELVARIELRSKQMLEAGLIEEARALMPIFLRDGRRVTSFQAIGYKQALDHLTGVFMDDGTHRDLPLEEVENRINLATRQYAKRQETWLKAEPDAKIVSSLEEARSELEQLLRMFAGFVIGD
jgi:tRNA dimethylallyltransferase